MSTVPPTLEQPIADMSLSTPSPPPQLLKPQRVLACVLCQQRKVKCNRKFPCANCIKVQAKCVPATLAQRQRRRRFPERALLERLRRYEDLLRQNNVTFEPLHDDVGKEKESLNAESNYDSGDEHPETGPDSSSLSTTVKSERGFEAKNIWHAMSQGFRDPDNDSDSSHDDVRETAVKQAWGKSVENDDHLLFGSRRAPIDLSTLHPDPVQIFRLWQIYLDNVNPLLKVTHTPSLQGRIIEAVGSLTCINSNLEALMFSIYCTSIQSLAVEDSLTMFGSSKEDLLMRYQFGCQQALLNCGFLRNSSDRDCLTALYLYLISVRPSTSPQSLSSMLGVAIRIAQRMGIHSESALAKCTAIEAEMRRRLWWSLILFDNRISEIADSKTLTLDPTWDCKIPLNVNDSDLRPEMKGPPAVQGKSTEALFAVVRCELGEFVRHTSFHLDFTSPALKPIARTFHDDVAPEGSEMVKLEEMIENQYLKSCDPENPIHFMTIWSTRTYLAKCRLLEHHSRYSSSAGRRTEAQHDVATSHALRMLECDTKTMTSHLTKGFLWLNHLYFPFPAYIQIVQDLRRRPVSGQARHAWEVMSDNYEAWFHSQFREDSPFFQIFTGMILQAWETCEAASKQLEDFLTPPRIVSIIRHTLAQRARHAQNSNTKQSNSTTSMGIDEFSMSMPMPMPIGSANQNLPYSMGMQDPDAVMGQDIYTGIPEQAPLDAHMSQFDWNMLSGQPGWEGC